MQRKENEPVSTERLSLPVWHMPCVVGEEVGSKENFFFPIGYGRNYPRSKGHFSPKLRDEITLTEEFFNLPYRDGANRRWFVRAAELLKNVQRLDTQIVFLNRFLNDKTLMLDWAHMLQDTRGSEDFVCPFHVTFDTGNFRIFRIGRDHPWIMEMDSCAHGLAFALTIRIDWAFWRYVYLPNPSYMGEEYMTELKLMGYGLDALTAYKE